MCVYVVCTNIMYSSTSKIINCVVWRKKIGKLLIRRVIICARLIYYRRLSQIIITTIRTGDSGRLIRNNGTIVVAVTKRCTLYFFPVDRCGPLTLTPSTKTQRRRTHDGEEVRKRAVRGHLKYERRERGNINICLVFLRNQQCIRDILMTLW